MPIRNFKKRGRRAFDYFLSSLASLTLFVVLWAFTTLDEVVIGIITILSGGIPGALSWLFSGQSLDKIIANLSFRTLSLAYITLCLVGLCSLIEIFNLGFLLDFFKRWRSLQPEYKTYANRF